MSITIHVVCSPSIPPIQLSLHEIATVRELKLKLGPLVDIAPNKLCLFDASHIVREELPDYADPAGYLKEGLNLVQKSASSVVDGFNKKSVTPTKEALELIQSKIRTLEDEQRSPSSVEVSTEAKQQADVLKEEGNTLLNAKDHKGAIKKYDEALKLNPYNPVIRSNRGAAYLNLKDYERAIEDCSIAIALDPKYLKPYYRLGQCYACQERYSEALGAFNQALARSMNDEDTTKRIKEKMKNIQTKLAGSSTSSSTSVTSDAILAAHIQCEEDRSSAIQLSPSILHESKESNEAATVSTASTTTTSVSSSSGSTIIGVSSSAPPLSPDVEDGEVVSSSEVTIQELVQRLPHAPMWIIYHLHFLISQIPLEQLDRESIRERLVIQNPTPRSMAVMSSHVSILVDGLGETHTIMAGPVKYIPCELDAKRGLVMRSQYVFEFGFASPDYVQEVTNAINARPVAIAICRQNITDDSKQLEDSKRESQQLLEDSSSSTTPPPTDLAARVGACMIEQRRLTSTIAKEQARLVELEAEPVPTLEKSRFTTFTRQLEVNLKYGQNYLGGRRYQLIPTPNVVQAHLIDPSATTSVTDDSKAGHSRVGSDPMGGSFCSSNGGGSSSAITSSVSGSSSVSSSQLHQLDTPAVEESLRRSPISPISESGSPVPAPVTVTVTTEPIAEEEQVNEDVHLVMDLGVLASPPEPIIPTDDGHLSDGEIIDLVD